MLGAAVADDVMGLVVLTVVVRIVTEGSVSVLSVAGIIGVARRSSWSSGGLIGLRVAPPLFSAIERISRSTGTLVALALAFTLAFAELADAAKLAPIVGAFVAGIALSRSRQSGRIQRELGPVGHLFIPVFFLQIGIDADVGAFAKGSVLVDAAILLAVATSESSSRRSERSARRATSASSASACCPVARSGLIFATIGLQNGVLGEELYAALLLVVLATTLAAPQLLKMRYAQMRGRGAPVATPEDTPPPPGGWLVVDREEVGLAGRPPDKLVVPLALEAAIALARRRPSGELLEWMGDAASAAKWSKDCTPLLLDVVERGNARSWRFLDTSGVLDKALPELAEALRARRQEGLSLDPLEAHRFESMEQLRMLDPDEPLALEIQQLDHVDRVLLATFLVEVFEDEPDPVASAGGCSGGSPSRPASATPSSTSSPTASCSGPPRIAPAASARRRCCSWPTTWTRRSGRGGSTSRARSGAAGASDGSWSGCASCTT